MTALEKFDAACAAYLKNLSYKQKSAQTINNYQKRLAIFRDFWTDGGTVAPQADPDYSTIERWRDALLDGGRKASTVRQYLKELGQFFTAFAKPIHGAELCYLVNPVDGDFIPTVEKRPYDLILTDEQIMKLLPDKCPTPQEKPTWARNYAIVTLLLTTKIRNAELLKLRLCDLDFEYGELTVERGKGGKFRTVDFPALAQSAVQLYLASGIRPVCLSQDAPLFGTTAAHTFGTFDAPSEKWHEGSGQWLSALVERHIATITGVSGVRTHDLRHVGARLALNAGASLEYIQSELGHANFSTTQIYSGRLMQRRGRNSAKEVLAEMERQAARNFETLGKMQPAKAV